MSRVLEIAHRFLDGVKDTGSHHIMACCPFHGERNPSFTMSLTSGLFHCFACKESGTLVTFLHKMGVSRTSIDIQYADVKDLAQNEEKEELLYVRDSPLKNPPLPEGALGLFEDYCPIDLLNAGFPQDLLMEFDIGYDHLLRRITFPLRDLSGRLIGVSGRNDGGYGARYKVYDHRDWAKHNIECEVPDKSEVIWNIERVYPRAYFGDVNEIIIVEGFKALLRLVQYGHRNVVALLGSYMSEQQRFLLEKFQGPFTLFLDNDKAGTRGTTIIGKLLSKSKVVKVATYPEGDITQPDGLLQEQVNTALARATIYAAWRAETKPVRPRWHSAKTKQDSAG